MLKNSRKMTAGTEYGFGDFEWQMLYLAPVWGGAAGPDRDRNKLAEFGCRDGLGQVKLAMPEGRGKVSDSGYDQFVCCCTSVPSGIDADISADITVGRFLAGADPSFTEAFGVFIRDTVDADPGTGLPYSNMAAAGGFLGRENVFIREGVHARSFSDVRSRWLDGSRTVSGMEAGTQPQVLKVRIAKRGGRVYAGVFDENGRPLICASPENGFEPAEDGLVSAALDGGCFRERNADSYYIGFLAARGAEIRVDKRSVRVRFTEAASTALAPVYAGPDGRPEAAGSEEDPLDLASSLNECRPGQEVRLLPGTYRSADGSVRIPKAFSGRPGAECRLTGLSGGGKGAVLDFMGTEHALVIEADDWIVSGLSVTGGTGVQISGNRNVIENCRAYGNAETGFLIRHPDPMSGRDEWPSCNLIRNCASYCNRDASENNADGFASKVASGEGNRFEKCIAFLNSDDGFDLFSKNRPTGAAEIVDCISSFNGYKLSPDGSLAETRGNGNGYKLGGCGLAVPHVASGCTAEWNKAAGFTNNSDPLMILKDCVSQNNKMNYRYYNYSSRSVPVKVMDNCSENDVPEEKASGERLRRLKQLLDEYGL